MNHNFLTIVSTIVVGSALAVSASPAVAASYKVHPGESIQAAIDNAAAGDKIFVYPGDYLEPHSNTAAITINKPLTLQAKVSAKDRELGNIVRILPTNGQQDGILAEPANPGDPNIEGVRIKGFTVEGFPGHGIFLRYVTDFRIENNTSINNLGNGIWPTLSANGRVKKNVSYGSEDAALWVEGATDVRVTQNEVYGSPTGLEVTISADIKMDKNIIHDNTVGVGLYHPNSAGLPIPVGMTPGNWELSKNHIYSNNAPNIAPPASQSGALPPGGGILLLGVDYVEVADNLVENNDFYGIAVVDYCIAVGGSAFDCDGRPPVDGDPAPRFNLIGKNTFNNNGTNPDPGHPLAPYAADFTYIQAETGAGTKNRFCANEPAGLTVAVFLELPTISSKCN